MNGLIIEQEAALTYAYMNQNADERDFTDLGISKAFVALRDQGMLQIQTDMGRNLVIFHSVLPEGLKHYDKARKARRWFEPVSDAADCLMMYLAALDDIERKVKDEPIFVTPNFDKETYYAELSRCDLLTVKWADNAPYLVTVTDKGRTYANGWFQEQIEMNNQSFSFSPVINNNVSATASAVSEIKDVTIGVTIGAILDLKIEQNLKNDAQNAIQQLEKAAKSKDKAAFSEKLEKAAAVAKSSIELASIMIPYVQTAIKMLMS